MIQGHQAKEYSIRVEDACRVLNDKIKRSKIQYSEAKDKIDNKYQDDIKNGQYFAHERNDARLQARLKIAADMDVYISDVSKAYNVRPEYLHKLMFGVRNKWLLEDYE